MNVTYPKIRNAGNTMVCYVGNTNDKKLIIIYKHINLNLHLSSERCQPVYGIWYRASNEPSRSLKLYDHREGP